MFATQLLRGMFRRTPSPRLSAKGATRSSALASAIEPLESRVLLSTSGHLVITPIYDSSITKDPNAIAIERALGTAIQNFENDIATPITVTIKFQEMKTGLAGSLTYHTPVSYSSYVKALAAHSTSAVDKLAVSSLPVKTTNPVNGGANIILSDANARALGFAAKPPTGIDSVISLNMSLFNLTRTNINASRYDLIGSASHEIDEVLGIDSGLNFYNSGAAIPTTSVAAEDLFRYDLSGHRSFTTNPGVESAFSFSGGTTFLARFNQTKGGDFNDWYSPGTQVPQVQDAFGTRGATPNLGTELTVLDTLGYKLGNGIQGGFNPDLTPAALAGWSSPLVLTTVKNSTVDSSSLSSSSIIYLDAAVLNAGEYQTTTAETNTIVLDGKIIFTFKDAAGLRAGNAYYSIGLSLGKLSAGTHTITINADTTNSVREIIESNNSFTRTFTVK